MHNRARHRYKATSSAKRDDHKPRQQPCTAAAPLPSTGRLSEAAPVPRAGFSRVPCTESPGGRLSAERQRGPEHPPRPRFEEPRPSKPPPPHSPWRRRAAPHGFSGEHFPCASRCNGLIKALGEEQPSTALRATLPPSGEKKRSSARLQRVNSFLRVCQS